MDHKDLNLMSLDVDCCRGALKGLFRYIQYISPAAVFFLYLLWLHMGEVSEDENQQGDLQGLNIKPEQIQ